MKTPKEKLADACAEFLSAEPEAASVQCEREPSGAMVILIASREPNTAYIPIVRQL